MTQSQILNNLNSLVIYHKILNDDVISSYMEFLKYSSENDTQNTYKHYYNFLRIIIKKAEQLGIDGNIFKQYVFSLILDSENIYSLYCEQNKQIRGTLYEVIQNDLLLLNTLIQYGDSFINDYWVKDYFPQSSNNNYLNTVESIKYTDNLYKLVTKHYFENGCGNFGKYNMFRIGKNSTIEHIYKPDMVQMDDIIGYNTQKQLLIENTERFINGSPANNCLLIGARGTGKSSMVKAVANKYKNNRLKLIELTKEDFSSIPDILQKLGQRGFNFILFVDDLSFEDFEVSYKSFKSLIEGSIQLKPRNVLFYVTSNRRNLVVEKWKDRTVIENDEEVHNIDAINEKISLSDRFGLTIMFPKPTVNEYVEIAAGIAKKEGLVIPDEQLREMALDWEINQNVISGRTARQFVNSLL